MGEKIIKVPDVGEGVAEAELVEWHVKTGDVVREDTILASVMTDKATVEIPSPVDGEVVWLGGEIGQVLAVGSPLLRIRLPGDAPVEAEPEPAVATAEAAPAPAPKPTEKPKSEAPKAPKPAKAGPAAGERAIKVPDVGEGVAEAELVEWHVKIGDRVGEDTVLASVMTDKATVEIPSPVEGEVVWLGGEVGQVMAVGSPLIRLRIEGAGGAEAEVASEEDEEEAAPAPEPAPKKAEAAPKPAAPAVKAEAAKKPAAPAAKPLSAARLGPPRPAGEKPLAAPAVRFRAKEAGVDLRQVPGTGPAGRITHEDLDTFLAQGAQPVRASGLVPNTAVEDIKVVGLRRKIAEKMKTSKSRIPHITYVEEIDVTALEELRASLNKDKRPDRAKLTLLPFLVRAMVKAIAEQPGMNALFDDEAGVIHRHGGVHVGIAAQTPTGLVVPVLRHAEARNLWECAAEVNRLAEAAKTGTATREELSGSTITITSLGAMGGVATTPVINHPEVAIVGVNKMMVRPVWDGSQFIPRKMMNLSSSFDHRVVDGWDAAVFVQRIKSLLETPALIFIED